MLRQEEEVERERSTSGIPRRGIETESEVTPTTGIRQTVSGRTVVANVGEKRETIIAPVAGFTAALIALHTASGVVKHTAITLFLTRHPEMNLSLEEASLRANVCMWSLWAVQMLLSTVVASYLPPRVARWSIALSNLLYLLAVTTEYSFTASPVWVMSRSQLTGWGYAVLGAVTISVAQAMAAEQLARWRERRKSSAVAVLAPTSR